MSNDPIGIIDIKEEIDYLKHIQDILQKYDLFIREYELENDILLKYMTHQNPYQSCSYHDNEPFSHQQAKELLFNRLLKYRNDFGLNNYLIKTEVKRFDHDLGYHEEKIYTPDIVVINVSSWMQFKKMLTGCLLDTVINKNTHRNILKQLECNLVFMIIEIDGTAHNPNSSKDTMRDNMFFTTYNTVTIRYSSNDLIEMDETEREKNTRIKYNTPKENKPTFENITLEDIVTDYKSRYQDYYPQFLSS